MTETTLLANYAMRRDAEAFAQLVTRYQRLIFATCRRVLHEPQDVDDAVQETFLRLAFTNVPLRLSRSTTAQPSPSSAGSNLQ